jgi:hypothetical protein
VRIALHVTVWDVLAVTNSNAIVEAVPNSSADLLL